MKLTEIQALSVVSPSINSIALSSSVLTLWLTKTNKTWTKLSLF